MINLQQNEFTGYRAIAPINKDSLLNPKHHAIILGTALHDNKVYVAELMDTGRQITTFDDFKRRYQHNGDIVIEKNTGKFSDIEVAQRALAEVKNGTSEKYDLITNNCESFANRAMHGHSVSGQVIMTVVGAVILVGVVWCLVKKVAGNPQIA